MLQSFKYAVADLLSCCFVKWALAAAIIGMPVFLLLGKVVSSL